MGTELVVVGPVARRPGWPGPGPGRPSLATPELKAEILERLALGEFLTAICQEPHMPSSMSVYRWKDDDPEFALGFARARELGALAWIEEGIQVSRTTETGAVTTYRSDGTVEQRREDMLGHRRLKADTFFKAAAVICPGKFGQKAIAEGAQQTINGNVTNVTLNMTIQEAAEIYAEKRKAVS